MVEVSQLIMARIIKNASDDDSPSGQEDAIIARKRSEGISLTTLVRVENKSAKSYRSTLWVIAKTLNVPMKSLIARDQPASSGASLDDPDAPHDAPDWSDDDYVDDPNRHNTGFRSTGGREPLPRIEPERKLAAKKADDPDHLD